METLNGVKKAIYLPEGLNLAAKIGTSTGCAWSLCLGSQRCLGTEYTWGDPKAKCITPKICKSSLGRSPSYLPRENVGPNNWSPGHIHMSSKKRKRYHDPTVTKVPGYANDLAKPSAWLPLEDPDFSAKFDVLWEEHVDGMFLFLFCLRLRFKGSKNVRDPRQKKISRWNGEKDSKKNRKKKPQWR